MRRQSLHFAFLNAGHFLDHLLVLVFATVAALHLAGEWGMTYAALIPYATPGFVAFGICALPAGWLADKWSREGMMVIFFVGIGASAIATALATTPLEMAAGLLAIGVFAAVYHPVGIALVVHGRERTGVPLAVNGIFGNLGVACAALFAGWAVDTVGWRAAFVVPGLASIATGLAYAWLVRAYPLAPAAGGRPAAPRAGTPAGTPARTVLVRILAVVFLTTAIGGLIFQSTTFALPKVFDERLGEIAGSATGVGGYAFVVFTLAAFAQLAVGYLVDRHSVRTVFAAVAATQAVLLATMSELSGLPALVVAVGFMLAVFGQIPINDVLIARVTRSEWRSRVYAARYIVTFSVMATSIPLIAWIHGGWGFGALFVVLGGCAACILAAVLALPRGQEAAIRGVRSPA